MQLSQRQVELTLASGLSQFGLNPREWVVDLKEDLISLTQGRKRLTQVRLRHREDSRFQLLGQAVLEKTGPFFHTSWKSLAFCE